METSRHQFVNVQHTSAINARAKTFLPESSTKGNKTTDRIFQSVTVNAIGNQASQMLRRSGLWIAIYQDIYEMSVGRQPSRRSLTGINHQE